MVRLDHAIIKQTFFSCSLDRSPISSIEVFKHIVAASKTCRWTYLPGFYFSCSTRNVDGNLYLPVSIYHFQGHGHVARCDIVASTT